MFASAFVYLLAGLHKTTRPVSQNSTERRHIVYGRNN